VVAASPDVGGGLGMAVVDTMNDKKLEQIDNALRHSANLLMRQCPRLRDSAESCSTCDHETDCTIACTVEEIKDALAR